MNKLAAVALALVLPALPASARPNAKVYHANGRPLTAPSTQSPAAIAAEFLRQAGRSTLTLATLREGSEVEGRSGLRHLRLVQEVDGMRVYGAYAKATVNARGELVHLIDGLFPVTGSPGRAAIDERQALRIALSALHPQAAEPAELVREGNVVRYLAGSYFHVTPTVERVVVQAGNALATGFLVQTWSEAKNILHHTIVGPTGAVLDVELRTNTDAYKVFIHNPAAIGGQILVSDPADPTASPSGWLTGSQLSTLISGNNARAYLDADKRQNTPDPGGETRTDTFADTWDSGSGPASPTNRNVAVQNLFFHNNLLHDTLYLAGFTEAEGNFQATNFGPDGLGNDPVQAEAQDGGGLDNANFATPEDGTAPRMQMYLWTGGNVVEVHSPAGLGPFYAAQAAFGPATTHAGVSGNIVLVNDGSGTTTDACESLGAGTLSGAVALMDRGTCDFTVKVRNAQNAGAIAALVANNVGTEAVIVMGGHGRFLIPASSVSQNTGDALKNALQSNTVSATVRAADPPPGLRDGDLDADIIWHEYGHGLTWRMIGQMSGPLAGAIGEGMSDVLALIHGTNDRVAEYSFSNPIGIRRDPYDGYPRTYGSLNTGTRQVHNDGEVYAAIGWRMIELYDAAGLSKSVLLGDLVEGMKYTLPRPAFEDMRDGILAGLMNTGNSGRECLVWQAFAEFGVGVGASAEEGTSRGQAIAIVNESFTPPSQCAP